jgi:hypothetical protein
MFLSLRCPKDGRVFPLRTATGRQVTVGSARACHVRVEGPDVAPTHVRIRLTEEGIELDNLAGAGATFVNGRAVTSYFLARNDIIRMGSVELVVDITLDSTTSGSKVCRRCGAATSSNTAPFCPGCTVRESGRSGARAPNGGHGTANLSGSGHRSMSVPVVEGYEVLGLLGEGAQGRVFKLRERATGRFAAVKEFTGTASRSAGRFAREADALRRLQHENIVGLIDFRPEAIPPLLLMEYVEGSSLTGLMKGGSIAPLRALSLLAQAAGALAYSSEQGVIHRDIKPANILVSSADRVRLTDFGLVRLTDAATKLTVSGNWVGTPYYMSPDQLSGGEVDARVDVWGLGATFYHALTGRLPFEAQNTTVLFKKILNDPVDLAQLRRVAGPEVAALFGQLLEKDAARRPWPAEVLKKLEQLGR